MQKIRIIEGLVNLLDMKDHIETLNLSREPIKYEDFHNTFPRAQRDNTRPNYTFQNQSRGIFPLDNRPSFCASTPMSYRVPETPKKENFIPRRDSSPNYRGTHKKR